MSDSLTSPFRDVTLEQATAIRDNRVLNRRNFLGAIGVAGAGLLATGCSSDGRLVLADSPSENDTLNFLLNLEYLEATFYSFATQGTDLPSSVTSGSGPITGQPSGPIQFPNQQITDMFNEIFFNELSHIEALQNILGSAHVPRPALNLAAAGAVSSANVITIARQFEDAGATAYGGATSNLTSTNLQYAAQILAVEGFQAGALRLISLQNNVPFAAADSMDVLVGDPGAAVLAKQGPTTQGGGFFGTTGVANATKAVPQGLAFTRTSSQILQVLYGAAGSTGVSSGGFFPDGMSGNIKTT